VNSGFQKTTLYFCIIELNSERRFSNRLFKIWKSMSKKLKIAISCITCLLLFLIVIFFAVFYENPVGGEFDYFGPYGRGDLTRDEPYYNGEYPGNNQTQYPGNITVDNETVIGWIIHPGEVLRLPANPWPDDHFTFKLGAVSVFHTPPPELTVTIEYILPEEPYNPGKDVETHPMMSMILEPDGPGFASWITGDVDMSPFVIGRGEIRIRVEPAIAVPGDIKVLLGQPCLYHSTPEYDRGNVLIIGVDTLRRDALSLYGGRPEVTPNLERLSQSGTIFENCHSQAPYTVPSFGSIMTGRYPADIISTLATDQLPTTFYTVSQLLQHDGFATGMICGNIYIGNENSGFRAGMGSVWYKMNAVPSESVEKAKDFIEFNRERNWFLFLHLMDPHTPYDPPQEYIDSLCDSNYQGEYKTEFTENLDWQLADPIPPQHEIDRVRCLYGAEVADVDSAIGNLLDYMSQNGYLENTLVVLCSDHGEEFYEHGQFEHGQSLYEEMVRLPLMIWGNGFTAGARIDTPVENLDIAPTIMQFIQRGIPHEYYGHPLQDIASGVFTENRIIFGEGTLRRGAHTKYALEWPYKCIINFYTNQRTLYNLENDPDERTDISSHFPEITQRLAQAAIDAMSPRETTFVVTILGNPDSGPERFSGVITVPDGINYIVGHGLNEDDTYNVEGQTVTFNFGSTSGPEKKALLIFPGWNRMTATVFADGETDPERFFPYNGYNGFRSEPSGSAELNTDELPWPAELPSDADERPVACYIIGIPGSHRSSEQAPSSQGLDPETQEQLRALGYIN
jgi:arylsulfatase A-like enzyme